MLQYQIRLYWLSHPRLTTERDSSLSFFCIWEPNGNHNTLDRIQNSQMQMDRERVWVSYTDKTNPEPCQVYNTQATVSLS